MSVERFESGYWILIAACLGMIVGGIFQMWAENNCKWYAFGHNQKYQCELSEKTTRIVIEH